MWGIFPDRESSSVCVMLEAPSDPALLMKAAPDNISLPTDIVEESNGRVKGRLMRTMTIDSVQERRRFPASITPRSFGGFANSENNDRVMMQRQRSKFTSERKI
jgi:hypothetical protein